MVLQVGLSGGRETAQPLRSEAPQAPFPRSDQDFTPIRSAGLAQREHRENALPREALPSRDQDQAVPLQFLEPHVPLPNEDATRHHEGHMEGRGRLHDLDLVPPKEKEVFPRLEEDAPRRGAGGPDIREGACILRDPVIQGDERGRSMCVRREIADLSDRADIDSARVIHPQRPDHRPPGRGDQPPAHPIVFEHSSVVAGIDDPSPVLEHGPILGIRTVRPRGVVTDERITRLLGARQGRHLRLTARSWYPPCKEAFQENGEDRLHDWIADLEWATPPIGSANHLLESW